MLDIPMNEAPAKRMKPKENYKGDINKASPIDLCESPSYALDPLLPYLPKDWSLWEPAAASGRMVRALERQGFEVTGSDIITGHNFFDTVCDGADAIVTNPPFSVKAQFVRRCYDIGLPFALILPVESIGSQKIQAMMEQYGAELLLLDKRINFHMPNKGWDSSAQFPTLWYCWKILPAPICYGKIIRYAEPEE